MAPNQVLEFGTLYAQNCAGCHGAEGRGGASIALANPVYLAIVDENAVHNVVANGVRGTSMPAFAQSSGGMLTDEQIKVITSGMFSRWGRKGILDGANPPSYAAKTTGDVDRGQTRFGTYCASCHGSEGRWDSKGSAITNDSFLALVSDQGLRTIVITGRPELRRTRLARKCSRKAHVRPGNHRCGCLVGIAPRAESRSALFRFELCAAPLCGTLGEIKMTNKPVIAPSD